MMESKERGVAQQLHLQSLLQHLQSRKGKKKDDSSGEETRWTNLILKKTKKLLEGLSQGRFGYEIETLGMQGFQILQSQKDLMQGSFVEPKNLSDKDGNWHIGAMAVLIDNIGAATIAASAGELRVSVNFDISYMSTVKIEEEVEIEAKVLNHKEKLSLVIVEIRRKENGELVALGKQWMFAIGALADRQRANGKGRSKL